MNSFSPVTIGKRWPCPVCRRIRLEILNGGKTGFCSICNRRIRIYVEDFPDPNAKSSRKGCISKRAHETEQDAAAHLMEIADRPTKNRTREKLCIYLCRLCNRWHVGHRKHHAEKMNIYKMIAEVETTFRESTKGDTASTGVE